MNEKLLPCPFCGGQPLLTTHGNEYTKNRGTEIKCSDCIVIRKTYAIKHSLGWTIDKAIELWNRRAPAPVSDYETREGDIHVTGVQVTGPLAERARVEAAKGPATGEILQSFAKAAPELFGDGPGPSSTAYDESGYAKEPNT